METDVQTASALNQGSTKTLASAASKIKHEGRPSCDGGNEIKGGLTKSQAMTDGLSMLEVHDHGIAGPMEGGGGSGGDDGIFLAGVSV